MVLQDQPLNHLASTQFCTALTAQITSGWGNGVAVPFLQPVLPTVETRSAHALLLEQVTEQALLYWHLHLHQTRSVKYLNAGGVVLCEVQL